MRSPWKSGSVDSVTQSINQAIASGSIARIRALMATLTGSGQMTPQMAQRFERAITQIINNYQNNRAQVLSQWLNNGLQPAVNVANVDYARYYVQIATRAIERYREYIRMGFGNIENLERDIALQTQRLNTIIEWGRRHRVDVFAQVIGPEGM